MGRTVTVYWEICEEIWSGSASVDAVPNATETQIGPHGGRAASAATGEDDDDPDQESERGEMEGESVADSEDPRGVKRRRALLNERITGYKSSKMNRKLTPQEEALQISREDVKLKRESLKLLASMEKRQGETMSTLTSIMGRIASSMESSLAAQQTVQNAPQFAPQPAPQPVQYGTHNHGNSVHPTQPLPQQPYGIPTGSQYYNATFTSPHNAQPVSTGPSSTMLQTSSQEYAMLHPATPVPPRSTRGRRGKRGGKAPRQLPEQGPEREQEYEPGQEENQE